MDEHDWMAERFEEHRSHLRAVAFRMLGSLAEADDAVQESWIRLSRSGASGVENLGGWLTTVTARVCLDMLRSRQSRREEPVGVDVPEPAVSRPETAGPEQEVLLAPAERVAFVLHDMFDLPFGQIGPIVGRSPAAARQLASRARRRVRGAAMAPDADLARQREVVDAFLAASRGGDFGALVALLDPEVVLRADAAAVRSGAPGEVHGAAQVAGTFSGRARAARPALVNGAAGLVWAHRGEPRMVFGFTISGGKIVAIDLLADPERIRQLDLVPLGG